MFGSAPIDDEVETFGEINIKNWYQKDILTSCTRVVLYPLIKDINEPPHDKTNIRAVAGQRISPELSFANRTKMFYVKNKRRKIIGPWNMSQWPKFIFRSKAVLHWLIFQKYDIHPSNTIRYKVKSLEHEK